VLRRFAKARSVQLAAFSGAVGIGAAGLLSGGWMVIHGDLSFALGMIGSTLPLTIGCIGFRRLIRAGWPVSVA
jgi:hypothetical protein